MRFIVAAMLTITVLAACAARLPRTDIPQQTQAAAVAMPDATKLPLEAGFVAVVQCRLIIGLSMIDSNAHLHPIPLDGLTRAQVDALLESVPADNVYQFTVPGVCGPQT